MLAASETITVKVLAPASVPASTAPIGTLAAPTTAAPTPPTATAGAPISHGGGGCAIGGGPAGKLVLSPYLLTPALAALRRRRHAA
jgi:hypothetical protein